MLNGAPSKLHRVNGLDANVAMLGSFIDVRNGDWLKGAPTHLAAELLEKRGYYLGVRDRDA